MAMGMMEFWPAHNTTSFGQNPSHRTLGRIKKVSSSTVSQQNKEWWVNDGPKLADFALASTGIPCLFAMKIKTLVFRQSVIDGKWVQRPAPWSLPSLKSWLWWFMVLGSLWCLVLLLWFLTKVGESTWYYTTVMLIQEVSDKPDVLLLQTVSALVDDEYCVVFAPLG